MNETNQSQGQTQNTPIKKPWYKKWWVITIGIIILLVIIGNSSEDNTDKQKPQEQPRQVEKADSDTINKTQEKPVAPAKLIPQATVTSANLAKEYSENEVAADEKYKGKIIEISGKVYNIDNGIFDNEMIVKLTDGQYDFNGPMCYMKESEKAKVLVFKKGQQVTLIGTGNSATIGSPMLKDCIVK